MEYREIAPPPALAHLVACFWTLEGDASEAGGEPQPVLPDGRPELIVHLADAFERLSDVGTFERQPRLIFAGQLTRQLVLRPTGRTAVLGVRFHSDSASAFFDPPQHELAGLTISVADGSASFARSLAGVADATDRPADALPLLAERLAPFAGRARIDPRVRYAVSAIRKRRGDISIRALASAIGSTPRHLERRFQQLVGLAPKRLARIARFQHALQVLESIDPARAGTLTAAMCGYADQAHFVRDFRDLAGCPPGAHLLRTAELTGFFRERA